MKKILIILNFIILFLFLSLPIQAEEVINSSRESIINKQKLKTELQQRLNSINTDKVKKNIDEKVSQKKEIAYKEIDRRIILMNKLISIINDVKKLTDKQKDTLTSQINSQITELSNLKTKIESDSDLKTLITDKQSIIKSYRIFAFFMPKINLIAQADKIINLIDKVSSKTNNDDVKNKLISAKTKAENAISILIDQTAEEYPGNKSQIENVHKILNEARSDLSSARMLLK